MASHFIYYEIVHQSPISRPCLCRGIKDPNGTLKRLTVGGLVIKGICKAKSQTQNPIGPVSVSRNMARLCATGADLGTRTQ